MSAHCCMPCYTSGTPALCKHGSWFLQDIKQFVSLYEKAAWRAGGGGDEGLELACAIVDIYSANLEKFRKRRSPD